MSILFYLVIMILLPSQAYAYIDPGLGSLIVQVLIITVTVVTTAFGVYYRRIKSCLLKIKLRIIKKDENKDENKEKEHY